MRVASFDSRVAGRLVVSLPSRLGHQTAGNGQGTIQLWEIQRSLYVQTLESTSASQSYVYRVICEVNDARGLKEEKEHGDGSQKTHAPKSSADNDLP